MIDLWHFNAFAYQIADGMSFMSQQQVNDSVETGREHIMQRASFRYFIEIWQQETC